jgi:hypothetical protein
MALENLTRGEAIVARWTLAVAAALALISWIRRVVPTSDPWPRDVDEAVNARVAVPLCTSCTYAQVDRRWFCPHCGFPTGEFVTTMPYLYIFALGESMRRGVVGPPERGITRAVFLVLFSASQYTIIFAPIYWYWMIRKAHGRPICESSRKEFDIDETS